MDEFDDPALDELLSSLPDIAMDIDTGPPPPPPPPQQQQQQPDDHSDLSTDFESDRSSEFSDPGFDDDVLAFVDRETNKPEYSYGGGGRSRYRIERGPADLKPTDPDGSPLIPQTLCCPPPTDVDCVRVSPVSGFQSPDMRFGPGTRKHMHKYLATHYTASGPVDDEEDIAAFARTSAEKKAQDIVEAYDCYEADGHMVDALDKSDPAEPATAPEAPPSIPLQDGLPASYGTDSWKTPSAYAEFSTNGSRARKPPPVSRARLNLVALSQRHNLFFAAFKNEIHVFRPQQAPEIVRGALLVLCPQPTEAATFIGGYHSHTAPHQVNHIITGDLGEIEILLMAYDDGDVFAYYTHHIVEYLSHKYRGHPTRSPPKPSPFFRETVGLSAWGLAIHSESRLIAVSSNLAEVTVFAPALSRPHVQMTIDHGVPLGFMGDHVPDYIDNLSPGDVESHTLLMAFRERSRSWRILLPVGQGGTNIPSIAFLSSETGNATWIVATDIDGYVIFLNIWRPLHHPLKVKVGQAKETAVMGWGVLPIPKAQLIRTKMFPKRCPTVLSRSHGLMNHSLNYSLVLDPSTDAIIKKPIEHYDINSLDRCILPHVPYTMRMVFELDCVKGGKLDAYDASEDIYVAEDDDENDDEGDESDEDYYDEDCVDKVPAFLREMNFTMSDADFPYFINNPDELWLPETECSLPPLLSPGFRHLPFETVDLQSGFLKPLIACPGTCQTWTTPTLLSLIRVLRSPLRHDSILSIPLPITADHSRPELCYRGPVANQAVGGTVAAVATTAAAGESGVVTTMAGLLLNLVPDDILEYGDGDYEDEGDDYEDDSVTDDDIAYWANLGDIEKRYVIFQTLSNGAQMFTAEDATPIYQVDNITSFTADEPRHRAASMVDMSRPYNRHSMIHFIPEISLLVVGKMQGQVVLMRPLWNCFDNESQNIPHHDKARWRLHEANHTPWAFRTEWTLPLQKDRTSEKYPLCCLLGIAVSPVPELGAERYALKKDDGWKYTRADGEEMPQSKKADHARRRWRLIMYYMDHTILQYYIEESESGSTMCNVQPVLQEAQQASAQRQQADPTRPRYVDGVRV